MKLSEKKILLTGGSGFLGSFVFDKLLSRGVLRENIRVTRSAECDLREKENCKAAVSGVDIVIHLAAHVGGIGLNKEKPGELFYDNAIMGIHLMEESRKAGVEKVVLAGTICAYPKFAPVPFDEDKIWDGYPEETNAPYGIAKKALLVQSEAYREQYNFNSIFLLPVNLYGPRDNFNPDSSHVIPALIKKIADAQDKNQDSVTLWGDGSPTREFLYVDDAAEGIVLATEKYNKSDAVNLGAGFEISIKDLAEKISNIMNFSGKILWDTSKPNGQPRRMLSTQKAFREFGFKAKTGFDQGLKNTIDWYLQSR